MKNPLTPAGIEPATFRFVTTVPPRSPVTEEKIVNLRLMQAIGDKVNTRQA